MASSAIGIPEAIIAQEQIKQQRNAAIRAQAQAVWEHSEQQKRDDMTSKYQANVLASQEADRNQRHAEYLAGLEEKKGEAQLRAQTEDKKIAGRMTLAEIQSDNKQIFDRGKEYTKLYFKNLAEFYGDRVAARQKTDAEFADLYPNAAPPGASKQGGDYGGLGSFLTGMAGKSNATSQLTPRGEDAKRAKDDLHDIRGLEKVGIATGNISKELDVQLKTINNKYQDEIKRLTRGKDQRQLKLMDEEIKRKQQEIALHKDLDPLQVANARMSGRLTFNKLEMSDMDKNVRKFITANDPNAFQYITKPGTQFLKARGDAFNKAFEARKVVDHYTLMADGYKKAKAVADGNAAGMKALAQSKDATLSAADKTKAASKALTYDAEAKQWQNAIDDVTANLGVAKQDFDQKSALKADYINADVKMKNGTRVIDPTTGRPSKKLTDGMLHSMNGPPPGAHFDANHHLVPNGVTPVMGVRPIRKPAQKAGAKKPVYSGKEGGSSFELTPK